MIDLLKTVGPFYKANLHCHTVVSDGKMTPEQIKELYKSAGYSIVAYTDHSKYRQYPELRDDSFLPIGGYEAAFICADPSHPRLKFRICHMNFFAVDPETSVYIPEEPVYDVGYINRYIDKMHKNGWLCTLNHPGWSLQTSEEVNELKNLDGFEVYNHHSQALDNNGDGHVHYALYLNSGSRSWAVSTDDTHAGYEADGSMCAAEDTCGGWIMISMRELSYAAFAESFRAGRFYASSGVEIKRLSIDEETDELVLACSPVSRVLCKGVHTLRSFRLCSKRDDITDVRIPLSEMREKEPFVRLELMTMDGKRAYSQPYWFEDGQNG